ncbi:uncharacterized protein DUF4375 [Arcticibacter tournemirensis]|uniref:DUF4375 domain-containing protein n=1 Tax=Arcticibacter tournemirensis TaxID=699437 RepID=A0A5M9GU24_9SPHI|nr:DUF4375 domain-containing protein [Arcticibacter tournemirensis]KAA8478233.1 DUF4375 domain-containing protein [Arcticibacter tournemirensis]TQM50740.1 uncharacterized protein DUF4375 [Arcticibacter tournemirensis]
MRILPTSLHPSEYLYLTISKIDKTSDSRLIQVVFRNIREKIKSLADDEYQAVSSLSKSRQAIYVIWHLQAEVNNGGFNQFYFNPVGKYAHLAPQALSHVGANKFSQLVVKANMTYEDYYDKITCQQDGTIEGFSRSYNDNPLNELDRQFYQLYSKEDLTAILIHFIRTHKQDFSDCPDDSC